MHRLPPVLFLLFFLFLAFNIAQAQNCPPPELNQEIYVFPNEAQVSLNMNGASGGHAEIVPQGQPFDNAMGMGALNGVITFQFLTPNTAYQWRARTYCNPSANIYSDWSPVYYFTTPPDCPATIDLPFETDVTLSFPAPPDPNIFLSLCGVPTNLSGYVFSIIAPGNGEYRLKFVDGSGGAMQTGIKYGSGNYCRTGLNCLTPYSEIGTYATLYANAGEKMTLAFSAQNGVTATRVIRLEYAPCPLPQMPVIDTIKPTEARLKWYANYVDVEIAPDTEAFTDMPDFEHIQTPLTVENLTPGTDYHWRLRGNCDVNVSPWVKGPGFSTPKECDSIPLLQCDSLYPGFKSGIGRSKMFKYRPELSHELLLNITPVTTYYNNGFTIALRDTALGNCFSQDLPVQAWPVFYQLVADTQIVSLGYVEKGNVYFIYADKWSIDSLATTLEWNCPEACPSPGNLTATDITAHSVQLGWSNNGISQLWELEIQTDSALFTGVPTHSGTGNTWLVDTLIPFTKYYWRIRQICPGAGGSNWSTVHSFTSEYDCDNAPELICNQPTTAVNLSGENLLTTCPQWGTGEGAERYFRFTPSYAGQYLLDANPSNWVKYAIKPHADGCGADSAWSCLGLVSPGNGSSWSLGMLAAGQTYLVAVDFSPYEDYGPSPAQFQILCPPPCPVPDSLTNTNVTKNGATLGWKSKVNQTNWEIEVVADSLPFTGTPNYFSNQNSYTAQDLWPGILYKWRVRGVCGSLGVGDWSAPKKFFTLPDCELYSSLVCDQEMTLQFSTGTGYWTNLPACAELAAGQEQILQFTVDDSNPVRYIFLPDNNWLSDYFSFYLKKASSYACEDAIGWQCVANNKSTSFFALENLEQGATYYLLCKKKESFGASTLRLSFHCSLPCLAPQNPDTKIFSASYMAVYWDGGDGPWKYEVALRYENGMELTKSNIAWSSTGHDFLSWFSISPNQVHGWRVRSICENGDTSDWTPYQYFKLPAECTYLSAVPCNENASVGLTQPGGYHFLDFCSGVSGFGQQKIARINVNISGTYSLRVNSNGHPAIYNFSEKVDNQCQYENWLGCETVSGLDTFLLSNLSTGTYLVQVTTTSTDTFSHSLELICPCPMTIDGKGTLFANGSAILNWNSTINSENWDIELVQQGQAFSGAPNYFSDQTTLNINSLDPSQTYEFRVRALCGAGQSSGWSASFSVTLVTDCINMPALACGDTILLDFPSGFGLVDYNPCDEESKGKELFFAVTPEYTGLFQMEVVQASGSAILDVHFGILEQCDDPDGAVTCIGHGGKGFYWLGYLQAGKTYIIVADNESIFGPEYTIALHCSPLPNDNPAFFYYPNPTNAYVIEIGDTCQLFTNRSANQSLSEPDMTQSPSTWYDVFEHDVWFVFIAPPGGTIQINTTSDPTDPMDPQIAIMTFISDTIAGIGGYKILATGEDNTGPLPSNAQLVYTGLTPGEQYFVVVDGANNTEGRFCLEILDAPNIWLADSCQTFQQEASAFNTPGAWKNLYAGSSDHVTGTLLGAIKTEDDLGEITISTEILPEAPVLPNGQKLLPRYFNIETQYPPQHPVLLRLFFSQEDLDAFNLTPPVTVATPIELGLTHYDGDNEDCDPANNVIGSGLTVSPSEAILVGENGLFYLEAVFNSFSEFGAALAPIVGTDNAVAADFDLQIYPNPVVDRLQIQLQSTETTSLQFRIFDTNAVLMEQQSLKVKAGDNLFQLQVGTLLPGVYHLILFREEALVGRAVIVKM